MRKGRGKKERKDEEGEERRRKREKKGEKRIKGGKGSQKFACDTHLKFTQVKRIQLIILGGGGGKKSNFSKNILPCMGVSSICHLLIITKIRLCIQKP